MARNGEHTATRAPATAFFWLAVLVASTSIMGLQGCRQLEEAADTPAGDNRAEVSFQDQLPGCWGLRVTAEGGQRDSLRSWLPEGSLPAVVEFDTLRAESADSDSVYRARAHGGGPAGHSFSVWRYSSGDSIRVQRAGALSGTMLELKPAGQKLVGDVVVFTDAQGMSQGQLMRSDDFRRRGPVEAVPVECPRK
jgi:hypothetical protein